MMPIHTSIVSKGAHPPLGSALLALCLVIGLCVPGQVLALMPPSIRSMDIFVSDDKTSAAVDVRGHTLDGLHEEALRLYDITTGRPVPFHRDLACRLVGPGVGQRDAPPGSVQKACRLWLSISDLEPAHQYELRFKHHFTDEIPLPLKNGVRFGSGPSEDHSNPLASPVPSEKNGRWGYQSSDGKWMIAPRFILARPFSPYGLAAVVDPGLGWIYIDQQGTMVIRPHVLDNGPDPFVEGLARFWKAGKMGFFNPRGEVVITPKFDFARAFRQGRSAVCRGCRHVPQGEHTAIQGGRWGFSDPFGAEVVPIRLQTVSDYQDGCTGVTDKGRRLILDRNGHRIESIHPHKNAKKVLTNPERPKEINMSWNETYAILKALAAIPNLNREQCEQVLQCEFTVVDKSPRRSWYLCHFNQGPVSEVELRYGSKGGIIILELNPASDRKGMLARVMDLGEPLDMDISTYPQTKEISFCYHMNHRRVWFTKKEMTGADVLVSIAIHF